MINQNVIDSKLTGNPQITYFKSVYRRHTFFMKFTREYTEKKMTNTDNGMVYSNTISHGGMDLISDVYYKNKIENIPATTIYANLGNSIIHNIKLEVNGKKIYHTTGKIMEMMSELENPYIPAFHNGSLTHPILDENTSNASLTVNSGNNYNIMCFAGGVNGSETHKEWSTDTFYSRPNFYFTRSYGSCFPICALYHSEIKIVAEFSAWDKIMSASADITTKLTSNLVIEYINLSQEEKRRVVNNTEPYIYFNIRSHQYNSINTHIKKSLPIRTIYFVKESSAYSVTVSHVTPVDMNTITNMTISHNNISKNPKYELTKYTRENIYRYYGNNGFGGRKLGSTGILDSIGIYTQSLEPGQEPNGHFSGDSEIKIVFEGTIDDVKIYYEYINFYKISSGQLDILFAEV